MIHDIVSVVGGLSAGERCRHVVIAAVGVTWKVRFTFWSVKFMWSIAYGFGVQTKDIWTLRLGVLLTILIQISVAQWFGLRSRLEKNAK